MEERRPAPSGPLRVPDGVGIVSVEAAVLVGRLEALKSETSSIVSGLVVESAGGVVSESVGAFIVDLKKAKNGIAADVFKQMLADAAQLGVSLRQQTNKRNRDVHEKAGPPPKKSRAQRREEDRLTEKNDKQLQELERMKLESQTEPPATDSRVPRHVLSARNRTKRARPRGKSHETRRQMTREKTPDWFGNNKLRVQQLFASQYYPTMRPAYDAHLLAKAEWAKANPGKKCTMRFMPPISWVDLHERMCEQFSGELKRGSTYANTVYFKKFTANWARNEYPQWLKLPLNDLVRGLDNRAYFNSVELKALKVLIIKESNRGEAMTKAKVQKIMQCVLKERELEEDADDVTGDDPSVPPSKRSKVQKEEQPFTDDFWKRFVRETGLVFRRGGELSLTRALAAVGVTVREYVARTKDLLDGKIPASLFFGDSAGDRMLTPSTLLFMDEAGSGSAEISEAFKMFFEANSAAVHLGVDDNRGHVSIAPVVMWTAGHEPCILHNLNILSGPTSAKKTVEVWREYHGKDEQPDDLSVYFNGDTSYQTTDSFNFLAEKIIEKKLSTDKDGDWLWFLDGHTSHIDPAMWKLLLEARIVPLLYPAHCTSFLQVSYSCDTCYDTIPRRLY